jgi:hypothetical protein
MKKIIIEKMRLYDDYDKYFGATTSGANNNGLYLILSLYNIENKFRSTNLRKY